MEVVGHYAAWAAMVGVLLLSACGGGVLLKMGLRLLRDDPLAGTVGIIGGLTIFAAVVFMAAHIPEMME